MFKSQVSIIIPTFNSEKTIERLLFKLCNQEKSPFQIIVVDGCSTDTTIQICGKYNVDIINNPKRHAAAARNLGIEYAKGEICAFIDSDCIPSDNWLETIIAIFQTSDKVVACGGKMLAYNPQNYIEQFAGNIFLEDIMRYDEEEKEIDKVGLIGAFITANCAYRKNILDELNGFNDFFSNNGEDIDLFWRCIKSKKGILKYNPKLIVEHSFPSTLKKLGKKYFQYGLASSKLTKVHSSKMIQIDISLYKKLFSVVFLQKNKWRIKKLYIVQITSHILGKIYGSIILGIVNL